MKFGKTVVSIIAAFTLAVGIAGCSSNTPETTVDANGNVVELTEFDKVVASSVALMDKNGGVEVITEEDGKTFTIVYDAAATTPQKTALYDAQQDKSFLIEGPTVLTPYAVQNLLKTQSMSYTKIDESSYRLTSATKGTYVVKIENGVITNVEGSPAGAVPFKSKIIYSVDDKASQYVVDAIANAKAEIEANGSLEVQQ